MQQTNNSTARPGGRLNIMDELRGFAVLFMITYHALYTLSYLYGLEWARTAFERLNPLQPFGAALFIVIAGVSSNLSHSNRDRGLRLVPFALLISLVTAFVTPSAMIWFGILHFLAVCMILFGLFQPHWNSIQFSWLWVALCVVLFFFTKTIPWGYLGFGPVAVLPLPNVLYAQEWLFPLGFYGPNFASADYFPLLPWAFLFLAGAFLGKPVAQGHAPAWLYPSRLPFLSWIGKRALLLYLLHQPLIYAVAWALRQMGVI